MFAYFGMIAMALVVMLMLTSISIFSGFLHKIELAAKGLFGDIVIEPNSNIGFGYYDEYIALTAGGQFELPIGRFKEHNQAGKSYFTFEPGNKIDTSYSFAAGNQYMRFVRYSQSLTKQKQFPISLEIKPVFDANPKLPYAKNSALIDLPEEPEELPKIVETMKPVLLKGIATINDSGKNFRITLDKNSLAKIPLVNANRKKLPKGYMLAADGKMTLNPAVKQLEAGDPFILTLGILNLKGRDNFSLHVQVAGIRLPGRATVSDFENGLFIQKGMKAPNFNPPIELIEKRWREDRKILEALVAREFKNILEKLTPQQQKKFTSNWKSLALYIQNNNVKLTRTQTELLPKLARANDVARLALMELSYTKKKLPDIIKLKEMIATARKTGASETEISDLEEQLEELITGRNSVVWEDVENRVILGHGLQGLSFKADTGEAIRLLGPGDRVTLSVAQMGREIARGDTPIAKQDFYIIDENRSGVSSIDRKLVYVPFDKLQQLNRMTATPQMPDRCSQIHFKVKPGQDSKQNLIVVADDMQKILNQFKMIFPRAFSSSFVRVQTWRQRQAEVVTPIENQRTLLIFFGSLFCIVLPTLIFVIFYTIISQKIREIGLLKALGASGRGIAMIFLTYGSVIGLVGGLLGILCAYYITVNINEIHNWLAKLLGVRIWNARVFMFDEIPNELDWNAAWIILAGAVASGILGALWPAIRAASMRPIKALRYE